VNVLISLIAATVLSPFGLYHHVPATDLDKPAAREELKSFSLVTVRGDSGTAGGGVGEFLTNRGNTAVYLYRRGTAVSDDEAAALARDHPDWIAHDRAGRVVTSNAGGQVIDVTNPAVRDWLVGGVARDAKAGNYDGVYLDVLGAFFSSRFYSARPVIGAADLEDTAWRDASVALIKAVKQATGKPVIANGFGLQNGKNYADHKADADQLIAAADGIQIEQFVRNGNMPLNKYKAPARWREDVAFLRDVGRQGKMVLADTRVRATNDRTAMDAQRDYALASFLVGAEGSARFRFAEGALTGTVDPAMADTISALGPPLGDAQPQGGEMVRRFAGGRVTVDPVAHSAQIDTQGGSSSSPPAPHRRARNWSVLVGLVFVALVVVGGIGIFVSRRR
jgi:hypothetical protein